MKCLSPREQTQTSNNKKTTSQGILSSVSHVTQGVAAISGKMSPGLRNLTATARLQGLAAALKTLVESPT